MRVVLDTNVLVSLLVFRDPRYARIDAAWTDGGLVVLANEAVAEELARVLRYPEFASRCVPDAVYAAYRDRVRMAGSAAPNGTLPQCRDADDQKFLELADAGDAAVLVTEDKALLRLRRRCRFAIEQPATFMQRLPAVDANA